MTNRFENREMAGKILAEKLFGHSIKRQIDTYEGEVTAGHSWGGVETKIQPLIL
jgi:hypothetical protein